MQATKNIPNLTNCVLLLGENETSISIDKQMLRGSGAKRIVFASSGVTCARMLANLPKENLPSFVLCAGLEDMDAVQWLHLIRLHPNLADLPVLLVHTEIPTQTLLEVARLGFAGELARPYNQKDLDFAILSVRKNNSPLAKPCADSKMFEHAIESMSIEAKFNGVPKLNEAKSCSQKAEAYLQNLISGKSLLRQKRYLPAINAFSKFLAEGKGKKGEALEGIAHAHASLGNLEKSKGFWQQAAAAYIEQEDFLSARAAFAQIYKNMEHKPLDNPLFQAGTRLLHQGHYKAAALAFLQGQVLTPNQSFQSHAARGCQFAINPEHTAEKLCEHIEQRSPSIGRHLRAYLLTPQNNNQPETTYSGGFFGIISEVFQVARHTARLHAAG